MFIGLTSNTEINILGAQLARDSFLVPTHAWLFPHNEDGAGMDLLQSVNATSMFAQKVRMEWWFQDIIGERHEETSDKLKEAVMSRDWVKHMPDDVLPLLIVAANGHKRPFHYGEKIAAGERVIFLKK
jgi:hypothetical protein